MKIKAPHTPARRRLQQTLVAAALWALATPSFAISLSNIELSSGLHQPFNASIRLRNFDPVELDRVTVKIADDAIQGQYDNANYLPSPLKISLKTTAQGTYIVLRSRTAIDEPFMKFAVQLDSPNGLILRQYEVLLDPPGKTQARVKKTALKTPTKPNVAIKRPTNIQVQRALVLNAQQRADGIELPQTPYTPTSGVPEVAALQRPPQSQEPQVQAPSVLLPAPRRNAFSAPTATRQLPTQHDIYGPSHVIEETAPETGALLSTPAGSLNVTSEDTGVVSQRLSQEEYLAALNEYSFANLVSENYGSKAQLPEASQPEASLSTPIPEVAALSNPPLEIATEEEAPAPVVDAIPSAVVVGQRTTRFAVQDAAFSSHNADAVAHALMAYRDRARAGKTSFNPRELVKLSATGVQRVGAPDGAPDTPAE